LGGENSDRTDSPCDPSQAATTPLSGRVRKLDGPECKRQVK
jgi:hypothetical protein